MDLNRIHPAICRGVMLCGARKSWICGLTTKDIQAPASFLGSEKVGIRPSLLV